MRRAASFLGLLLACATALAQPDRPAETRFFALALHDVEDATHAASHEDAITTDKLVAILEWIRGSGMRPITLDDLDAARRGVRPLPERAILLMFDDGYRSLYTRVYPLLLAYRIPAVAGLVTEWLEVPPGGMVVHGSAKVPRERYITWPQAREMADSGVVEFASHTHAMHTSRRANPQGSERPLAMGPLYDPASGYETHEQFRARIAADLERSRVLMRERLGRVPRAVVWPYGRYGGTTMELARAAGFDFAFTLDPEPADIARPLAIARFIPRRNPSVGDMMRVLAYAAPRPVQSMVCLDPARLAGDELEARLGKAIERVRTLGVNAVAIDPFARDAQGVPVAAWFPTAQLPVRADVLSRIAWQLYTRTGVRIYLRIPRPPGVALPWDLPRLARDMADAVEVDGLLFESAPPFEIAAAASAEPAYRIRERRARVDISQLPPAQAQVLSLFRAMEAHNPNIQLALLSASARGPVGIADITFVETRADEPTAAQAGGRRFGPWITSPDGPPDAAAVRAIARAFKVRGAMAAGWCPDDPLSDHPAAAIVAPETSARRTPEDDRPSERPSAESVAPESSDRTP